MLGSEARALNQPPKENSPNQSEKKLFSHALHF